MNQAEWNRRMSLLRDRKARLELEAALYTMNGQHFERRSELSEEFHKLFVAMGKPASLRVEMLTLGVALLVMGDALDIEGLRLETEGRALLDEERELNELAYVDDNLNHTKATFNPSQRN